MAKGWKRESARHSLARKGIKTGRKKKIKMPIAKPKDNSGQLITPAVTPEEFNKFIDWVGRSPIGWQDLEVDITGDDYRRENKFGDLTDYMSYMFDYPDLDKKQMATINQVLGETEDVEDLIVRIQGVITVKKGGIFEKSWLLIDRTDTDDSVELPLNTKQKQIIKKQWGLLIKNYTKKVK
jgi:hypothetical protein